MVNSAAAAKLLRPLKKKKTIRQEKGAKDSDSFITFCSVPGGGRTVPLTVPHAVFFYWEKILRAVRLKVQYRTQY
jgi:hypothetical protein